MKKSGKRVLAFLLTVLFLVAAIIPSSPVWGATVTGSVGQFKYEFDTVHRTAKLIGVTENFTAGDVVIPGTVEYDNTIYTVTDITYRFNSASERSGITSMEYPGTITSFQTLQNMSALTKVVFQEGIISINANSMFFGCKELTDVALPSTLKNIGTAVFSQCEKLKDIVLPEGLESLGISAFSGSALERITIPAGVTVIPASCFYECKALEEVIIQGSITAIERAAFMNCESLLNVEIVQESRISIVEGDSLGGGAFQNCASLVSVILPNGSTVAEVGGQAFSGCKALETVTLKGLNAVGYMAFAYCNNLTGSIDLSEAVLIEAYAFWDCNSLAIQDLTMPHIARIEIGTFYHCFELSGTLSLPNAVEIGAYAFEQCKKLESIDLPKVKILNPNAFAYCDNLASLNLPEVVTVGEKAFYRNEKLTGDLILPNAVNIGDNAFYYCYGLNGKIELPNVVIIGGNAFYYTLAKELVLGEKIAVIKDNAFIYCYRLESVYIGSGIESIGNFAFYYAGRSLTGGKQPVIHINAVENYVNTGSGAFTQYEGSPEIIVNWLQEDPGYDSRTIINHNENAPTLQNAVDAIEENGVVVLEKDVKINTAIRIPSGKTVELQGDFSVTPFLSANLTKMFQIEEGAKLIINGVTISGSQTVPELILVDGELVLKDGIITLAEGGAMQGAVHVNGRFTMEGGEISYNTNGGVLGSAVYVAPGGLFDMKDGSICNNTLTNSRAGSVLVFANSTADARFNMTGGTISGNSGVTGAGVFLYSQTSSGKAYFVMNGGYIEENNAAPTSTLPAGGGGVMAEGNSSFLLLDGYIRNNTVIGHGGGIATATYGKHLSPVFVMNGGYVTGNKAFYNTAGTDGGCGGGIYIASHDAEINGGYIQDNESTNQGGGIYVGTTPYVLHISNALITENHAKYMGGGIWSCPTGTTENFVNNGGAIFDNTSDGAGADIALINKGDSAVTTLSDRMLGGGLVLWYEDGKLDYSPIGISTLGTIAKDSKRFDPEAPGKNIQNIVNITRQYSLIGVAEENAKTLAVSQAKVFISGNKSYRGGGIGTNGGVVIGDEDGEYTLTVEKKWEEGTKEEEKVEIEIKLQIGDRILDSIYLNNENNWSDSFDQLPDPGTLGDAKITVLEVIPKGFSPEYSELDINDESNTITITVTNHKLKPGSLTVTKEITGETGSHTIFEFELQRWNGEDWESYTAAKDAPEGKFTLTSTDRSITVEGLPAGELFRVIETNADKVYTVSYSDETNGVEIVTGEVEQITVRNTRNTGSLKVKKIVEKFESFDENVFPFQLQINTAGGWMPYPTADTDDAGYFTLEGGAEITFTGLPAGERFRVVEKSTGVIYSVEYSDNQDGIEIDSENTEIIVVTNTRKQGSLKVEKVVERFESYDHNSFTFQLQRKNGTGWEAYSTTGTDNNGKFTLEGGSSITFTNLPAGETFRAVEQNTGTIYTVEYSDGQNGVSVSEHTTASITIKNTRKYGTLTVTKSITGFDDGTEFEFILERKLPADGSYIPYIVPGKTDENGMFKLKGGNSVLFTNMPAEETFRVRELYTGKSYTVLTGSLEQEILADQNNTMAFVNERNKITVSGTKTWIGDRADLRPDSITVFLYANGVRVNKLPEWTKNGEVWTYVFKDLDGYIDNQKVVYTVEEEPVDGYSVIKNGYNFINIYEESPAESDITLYINKILTDEEGNLIGTGRLFYIQIIDVHFNVIANVAVPANGATIAVKGLKSGEIYAIQEYTDPNFELVGYSVNNGNIIESRYLLFQSILSSETVSGHIYITAHNVGKEEDVDKEDPKEEPEWPGDFEEPPIEIPPEEIPLGPPPEDIPETGDPFQTVPYMAAAVFSLGTVFLKRRRKRWKA